MCIFNELLDNLHDCDRKMNLRCKCFWLNLHCQSDMFVFFFILKMLGIVLQQTVDLNQAVGIYRQLCLSKAVSNNNYIVTI